MYGNPGKCTWLTTMVRKSKKLFFAAALLLAAVVNAGAVELGVDSISTPYDVDAINANIRRLYASKLDLKPGNVIPKRDSTYTLGSSGNEWLRLYVDTITVTTLTATTITASTVTATTAVTITGASPSTPAANTLYKNNFPKVLVKIIFTGGVPSAPFAENVSSLTDNGTGDVNVNFARAFSSSNYVVNGTGTGSLSGDAGDIIVTEQETTYCRVGNRTSSATFAGEDRTFYLSFFGPQ